MDSINTCLANYKLDMNDVRLYVVTFDTHYLAYPTRNTWHSVDRSQMRNGSKQLVPFLSLIYLPVLVRQSPISGDT
jgi:hypothetical protein